MQKQKTYRTTCSYCGVGCGIVINKDASGKLSIEGDKENPVNFGMLCSKGRNLLHVVKDQSDRLLFPQHRNAIDEPLERLSWDNALNYAKDKISSVIEEHGSDAVGFYVSGQCLTEEYYVANKLVKGFIGTNNIDTNSRLCMSSAVMGYKMALGDDTVPATYEDIELSDCILISGANPAWCHPILFRRLENHKEKNPDTKIIVVDPRVTDTCSIADVHLQVKPGADIALNNALAKVLIDEELIDYNFISKSTNGFDKLLQQLATSNLETLAAQSGVSVELIQLSARLIGRSKGFISLWAMGLNQSSEGVNKNLSLLNLSLLTGKIGKPGSGPLSLTGQPNAMGGREVGGMATLLAAHHNLNDANHRLKVQQFWNSKPISGKPGLTATKMIEALEEGKLKVLWIICTNPLVSLPDLNRVEAAMKKAELVIVQDISNRSDTLDFAHLVLPAAGWMEKEGTMTNSDRRISYLNKVVSPPGEAKTDVEILCEFAKRMGYAGFGYQKPVEIFNEYRQLTKGTTIDISALSYQDLKENGSKQWPVTLENKFGTKRLFTDGKFYTPDGKAQISAVEGIILNEQLTKEFPFVLTTGRIRDQWHTRTRTGKVNKLNEHIENAWVSIHPETAKEKGITDKEIIRLNNDRGSVQLMAKLDDSVDKNTLFVPMHWGKVENSDSARANNLTSSNVDPISKQPEFKYAAINVEKIDQSTREIVIVGAGAAAHGFIVNHRKNNRKDKITVISAEPNSFYNRVLLPEFINGEKDWNALVKFSESEVKDLGIKLYENTSAIGIDSHQKTLALDNGETLKYDKLILATGSSPVIPPGIDTSIPGIFTLRSRYNAEAIMAHVLTNAVNSATVVGGGILGLEMADALNEMGIKVTLLVRGASLMRAQLDQVSAKLLATMIDEKGIHVRFNTSIDQIENTCDNRLNLMLNDSTVLNTGLLIMAVGTKPNMDLALNAGLKTNRGVVVNSFMQTSERDIFAMGEIAEFNNNMHGITIAAEEQAEACASFFSGNYFGHYKGSVNINLLKCTGIELCSLGTVISDDPEVEEIILSDPTRNYYKKCLVKNDRLIGAILLGDKSEYPTFKELIQKQTELGDERDKLLRSSGSGSKVDGDLVCSCNQVGRTTLENFVKHGCSSFEGLMVLTSAGTGCGSCKPEIKKIMQTTRVIN